MWCSQSVAVSSEQWKAFTAATPCAAQAVLYYLWWVFPHLSHSWWSPLSPHSLFRPTCQQINIQTPPTPTNHSSMTATPLYIPVWEREKPHKAAGLHHLSPSTPKHHIHLFPVSPSAPQWRRVMSQPASKLWPLLLCWVHPHLHDYHLVLKDRGWRQRGICSTERAIRCKQPSLQDPASLQDPRQATNMVPVPPALVIEFLSRTMCLK